MQAHTLPSRALLALFAAAGAARADLNLEWVSAIPSGTSLSAGLRAFVVDPAGVSYATGTGGSSSNTDVLTAAFGPDGTLLWSQVYNGPGDWHDQARGIALGPNGVLWVTGNTPDALSYAQVLLLKYDAASGTLLKAVQYSSAPFTSEHGASVATDAQGNVYVGGGTVGDGADALVLKFDSQGVFQWKQVWDGPAIGPYSQDDALEMLVDQDGNALAMIHGVMASNHPDYVVIKYAPDGATLWEANWGVSGGDFPRDMELDAAGDVYVTGTGIDLIDKYSTIKLRGADGHLLWQAYDFKGADNGAAALELDGRGFVYVTGAEDPDGDHSNLNDNFYTVKRNAGTGAFAWSHSYGLNCIGCYDVPSDVRVDSSGNVFVTGATTSAPYSADQLTLVLDWETGLEIERGVVFGASGQSAGSGILRFDGAENLYGGSTTYGFDTGQTEMAVTKYTTIAQPLYQLQVTALVTGAGATFGIEQATPAALQFLVWSVSGTGSLPILPLGVDLGVADPHLLLAAPADATGAFATTLTVPVGIAGFTLWFQSIELGSASPVVKRIVQ
jgi:hypothetical protein